MKLYKIFLTFQHFSQTGFYISTKECHSSGIFDRGVHLHRSRTSLSGHHLVEQQQTCPLGRKNHSFKWRLVSQNIFLIFLQRLVKTKLDWDVKNGNGVHKLPFWRVWKYDFKLQSTNIAYSDKQKVRRFDLD
jgi:hypothetical protein